MSGPGAVRGLSGQAFEAAPEQLHSLVAGGAKQITPEEAAASRAAFNQMRETDANWSAPEKAAAGVFSGTTLGLGPAGLAALGLADRNDVEALQGSGYYQAGNVAGIVAPALLTGGESVAARGALEAEGGLLGRALGWTPAGLMGRAGTGVEALVGRMLPEVSGLGKVGASTLRMAARGSTEGTIVNLAHTVSDSYIQDRPLTAQSLAASGVNGALFGGLAGGILGGAGALAGAGVDSLGGSALGAVAGKGEDAAAKVLRRMGHSDAEIASLRTKEGGLISAVRGYHGELSKMGADFGSNSSTIAKVLKESEGGYAKAQADIVGQLDHEAGSMVPDVERVLAGTKSDLETKFGGTIRQNDVARALGGLQEDMGALRPMHAEPFAQPPQIGGASLLDPEAVAAHGQQLQDWTAAKALHDQASQLLPKAGGTWKQWIASRAQLSDMVNSARGGITEDVYRTALNSMDREIGAAMDAAGSGIGKESLGEQFRAAVAGQKLSEEMGVTINSKIGKELAGGDGAMRPTDMGTMAWGTLMGHPLGAAGIVAAKGIYRTLERKIEPAMAEAAYRNAVGAQAANATIAVGNRVSSTLKKFMGLGGRVSAIAGQEDSRPKYSVTSYKKAMELSEQLTSDVHKQKVNDMVNAMSQMGHQDLANEMAAQYERAVAYLNFNKPKDAKLRAAGSLGKQPTRMGLDTKESRYMRIFAAVSNPMSIVDGILDGSTSREAVNAVAYIMPEWHQDIVSRAANMTLQAKEDGKFLPADKIATLGVVLNAVVDTKLAPEFITEVQRGLQANAQPQPEAGKPAQPGQLQLAQTNDYKTPMQTSLG